MDWTELSPYEQTMRHSIVTLEYERAIALNTPFYLIRPRLFLDGTMWCALYGDNLQQGIAGFGETPEMAVRAFNDAWKESTAKTGDCVGRIAL